MLIYFARILESTGLPIVISSPIATITKVCRIGTVVLVNVALFALIAKSFLFIGFEDGVTVLVCTIYVV